MKLTLLVCCLLLSSSNFAQENLTPKQCITDREAWGQLTGEDMNKLSVRELMKRENELHVCSFMVQGKLLDYASLANVFVSAEKSRMFGYLDRHGYWQKFLDEDERGVR